MFQKPVVETTALDLEIARLYAIAAAHSSDSDEYVTTIDQLIKLETLKDSRSPKGISNDVKATIAANLAGITAILLHERVGIITSKAVNFILKLK